MVMLHNSSTSIAWSVLKSKFLGQRESHSLLLSIEFHRVKQGATSITNFCNRLKTMASALTKFGDLVGIQTLMLTLLHGLNDKFCHMVSNLKMQHLFPTFKEARTLLLLEEIDIDDAVEDAPSPTFVTVPYAPSARRICQRCPCAWWMGRRA
jgi:hypothetical protein